MRTGFVIGVLWTIGIILTGKLNMMLTGGQYASGFSIFLMTIFIFIAILMLTIKQDALSEVEVQ